MCRADLLRSPHAKLPWTLPAIFVILITAPCASAAEKGKDAKSKDAKSADAPIRATAEAFVQAFNRGDAKALAAMWTEAGTLADDRGELFKGRPAIEKEYAAFFQQNPGAKLEIAVTSVDFPTPTMAIEDGAARVALEHAGPPVVSRYVAVHVLQDGKWLMTSVREWSIPLPASASRIEELGWLIGDWEAAVEGTKLRASFRWIADKRFIQREYTVRQQEKVSSSGTQIIGWDPQSGQIRSWSFDSSGGFGEGIWAATAEGWSIESRGVLADGTPTSSRDFLIRVAGENNVLGWRSADRTIGPFTLPDMNEVVLDKVAAKP
jgi:uncharacterized protein (TIGR02246 family)